MWDNHRQKNDPGQDPALIITRSLPARRQVSVRWLTGTVLTGVIACILIGIVLLATLNKQKLLGKPPQWFNWANLSKTRTSNDHKSERISPTRARHSFDKKRKFELSVLQKKGDRKIVQPQTFEWIKMSLSETRANQYTYPKFDALNLFASPPQSQSAQQQDSGYIYGAKMQAKMTLRTHSFIPNQTSFDETDAYTDDDVQMELKKASAILGITRDSSALLTLADPLQLGNLSSEFRFSDSPEVRIFQENVTVSPQNHRTSLTKNYVEDIILIRKKQKIAQTFEKTNYTAEQIERVVSSLSTFNHSDLLQGGSLLRIGIVTQYGEDDHIVRASIYRGTRHVLTIALNDYNEFVKSAEPEMSHALKAVFQNGVPGSHIGTTQLPTVYDAVYQAVLSHNMPQSLSQSLIRLLATNVDMQSRVTLTDQLEIFYAVPKSTPETEKQNTHAESLPKSGLTPANGDPEIRYVSATFGRVTYKYYRYQADDGTIDYYDSTGQSSKPFLLRKPTPNGLLGSPFGLRKHPILGYVRMHTGVDWIAKKGSPIIAVGDGVVTKIGTRGNYGNHTEIQHANGYSSSYSHQSHYAAGLKQGSKVRQGQIIGYVGTTGLTTGAHCHFEISVNNTKVDPMRIRLPSPKALTNQDLEAFLREKRNIDTLLNQ